MMKKKTLTIISPVYNGEKYIQSICEQLDSQTYKDFEVIFVDDCSTDNSYKILKQMEKKYQFIKVFRNKKNSGAGFSRNYAIENTDSKYIGFLDSDDKIPSNYFEALMNVAIKKNADLALCDVKVVYDESFKNSTDFFNTACHKTPISKTDILNNPLAAASWNKVIKRSIIVNNLFSVGIINEDIPAIIGSIIDADEGLIAYTNETYYTYIQRKSSVQNGTKLMKRFDVFEAFSQLIDRKKNSVVLKENLDILIYHQLISFLLFGILTVDNSKGCYKYLKLFEEKIKQYDYQNNKYYLDFISKQSKKVKIYYKTVLLLMKFHMFYLASLVLKLGNKYSKIKKNSRRSILKQDITIEDLIIQAKRNQDLESNFSISVVVPNYNYARFLYQRIYSILYQNVKINELIILDDCSSDNSRDVIDDIYDNLHSIISMKKVYNDTNSGSPFKQWSKGFSLAKSEYVWISEADDYSSKDFLKEVVKPMIVDKEVVLSYCDTSYIDVDGVVVNKSVKSLVDIMKTGHFNKTYVNDGIDEIKNYLFLNCTIANVSSVVFKNDDYSSELLRAGEFKQCGDWYFYFTVMKRGKVSYNAINYNKCRLHGTNSTTSLKKKIHFEEIKIMQNIITSEFTVRSNYDKYINDRLNYLKKVWDLSD